jgi:ABC-type transport system involved in cytochrome c biogenesis permease subunit
MNGAPGWTSLLLVAVAAAYGVAWLLYWGGRRRAAHPALAAAWVLNSALFALNWAQAAGPPFGNMYHVHVVLALCFPPLFLLVGRRDGMQWSGGYFAFAAAVVLLGAHFMDPHAHWRRMPALQSPWFVPHVCAYMVSYALAAVAFAMTVVKWRHRDAERRTRYAQAAHQIVRLGFPFMTFGMLSGALWAEEAWGVYWSWDPKETWSLITWTGYLVCLHCRHDRRTARWADTAQTLAFGALLWTFFLVNLMPRLSSVLHGYAR